LFPGLAVAEQLCQRGCAVTLLISSKEVDQQAVKTTTGMDIVTLPAVGLSQGRRIAFVQGFIRSYRAARRHFKAQSPPQAALAMGGFTSAPPIIAVKMLGAQTYLHESNSVPGRANRWLSWVVDRAFIGFPSAAARLHARQVSVTGTPVRSQFRPRDAAECRAMLGLDPKRAMVLVMGGSQGASGINDLVVQSLPLLAGLAPEWQWLHLTGPADAGKVQKAYDAFKVRATVKPFFAEMELALGAASAAISRAGASSLAELAATRLPAVLIPYPAATEDHQLHNARAFADTGAATLLEQRNAAPTLLIEPLVKLVRDEAAREKMRMALARWHQPQAAKQIADDILGALASKLSSSRAGALDGNKSGSSENRGSKMDCRSTPIGRRRSTSSCPVQ
jgi:UDP-N-acetylglucosamine--N-acetylmuramyl-(pentapeptide) pyrophosphoryl-undecaprenol N-acetylglucosamine transferase